MSFDPAKCEAIAQELLGMKFKFGARGENGEIDCYGVLKLFYARFGIEIPDYSYVEDWDDKEEHYLKEYASLFRRVLADGKPEAGDMILFHGESEAVNHAGIYLGEGRFIHAQRKIGTKIDEIWHPYWKKKLYGFFRIKRKD
jgi:cell wall-associated NlpC family hydrolase